MRQSAALPVHIGTLHRLVQTLPYFVDWTIPQLKVIVPACAVIRIAEPVLLQRCNGLEPFTYFLLKGSVHLSEADGSTRVIEAGDLDAGFPIAQLRPGRCDVEAQADAELLRVESSKLRSQQHRRNPRVYFASVAEEETEANWRTLPLVRQLLQQGREGTLTLPAIPGIALRVRRTMAQENYRLEDITAIVTADPAIVARLLKVANSALFASHGHCDSVKSALSRLGALKTQQIVMSLLARDLFVAKHPVLKNLMLQRWRHAVDIAAICAVLARMTPGLQSERALLVGLLHEIGVLPILRMAEAYPDLVSDQAQLEQVLEHLTPELSAMIMEQWQFDEDFRTAALNQNQWFREHDGAADYTDILTIAHLHAHVRERVALQLPRIDETPAFEKLAMGKLTPNLSLFVLEEARAHIQELKTLLM